MLPAAADVSSRHQACLEAPTGPLRERDYAYVFDGGG